MIIFLNLLAILALSFVADGDEKMGCNFFNHLDGSRKKGEDQIEVLKGKRCLSASHVRGWDTSVY